MRGDGGGKVGEGTHRGAQHHAVGAGDGAGGIGLDPVGEAELPDPIQGFLGPRGDDHLGGQVAALAGDARDGAADQADADQRQALENRFRHAGPA